MQRARLKNSLPSMAMEEAQVLLGSYQDTVYYAWPQRFGSTAGPFPGIGGAAVSTFTMEAWVGRDSALVFCNGRIVKQVPLDEFAKMIGRA